MNHLEFFKQLPVSIYCQHKHKFALLTCLTLVNHKWIARCKFSTTRAFTTSPRLLNRNCSLQGWLKMNCKECNDAVTHSDSLSTVVAPKSKSIFAVVYVYDQKSNTQYTLQQIIDHSYINPSVFILPFLSAPIITQTTHQSPLDVDLQDQHITVHHQIETHVRDLASFNFSRLVIQQIIARRQSSSSYPSLSSSLSSSSYSSLIGLPRPRGIRVRNKTNSTLKKKMNPVIPVSSTIIATTTTTTTTTFASSLTLNEVETDREVAAILLCLHDSCNTS